MATADLGVEVDDYLHVLHVRSNIPEFMERGRLNLPADFTCLVAVDSILGFKRYRHCRRAWLLLAASMISISRGSCLALR